MGLVLPKPVAVVEEHVRHIHDEAAGGVASFQDQVKLLEETGAKLFAVANGVLKLCIGGGRGGAIPVGIRFGYMLFLLCVVAVSFGIGLSASGLLKLRVGWGCGGGGFVRDW